MLDAALRLPGLYRLLAFLTARRVVVRGPSMTPTLLAGEYVLFDRLAYRRAAPRSGDVVLAEQPGASGRRVVKRVAGTPGETVSLDGGERELGDDEYLLLGDEPSLSTDGRDWGPVARRAILARAWLVYWPPSRARRVRREYPEGQA